MSFTHSLDLNWRRGGDLIQKSIDVAGGAEINIDEAIADSVTDGEVAFELDVSQCKSFYIVSDQAVTVETNDGSAPDDTLSLAADVPYVWHDGDEDNFLLGTDVTALFVTNASGSTANLKIRCLYDPTV